ncbi:MAG: ATP-binding protein, partial [Candidatus Omnitrophica bacterium]|nr:ATP-binding protein [Candidatus Omnitrophota bacterium]
MKSILKITTVMLVQALLANCAWAGVLLPPAGRRRGGCSGAALSPAVHIHINTFQDIFAASAKEGFLTGPGPDDEEEIGTAETTYLEFNMIFHQLNNVLQVVRGDIDILETEDELKDGEEIITAFVKDMVGDLADITSIFSAMDIIIEADILYLNEKVKQLNEKYAVLKELERVKTEDISVEISGLIARMISATEFVNRRIQAVREGINLEYFDLGELLKQEEDKGDISIEKGLGLEIFGYRDGMEFVIKNIIRNIIEHGRAISVYFEMSVKKDANNIVIEIKDTGRGFDFRELKNKAVELGFWDKEKAASAKEPETIELIFKKGFSRRYVKGKAYGLGMWLSRQVIEKYFNGTIRAQNRTGQSGAKFIVTVPIPEEKPKKRVANPRELLYQWAINRDEKQISQAWTHRSIAKAAGISKSAVTKHLPAIEKRLVEEKRPAIKKKLVDVAKVLYRWARNRDEKQINQEWTQKEIAKVAGVSESAISNHFAGLKKRLKKEKLPPIEIKLTPEEKFYQWAIARTVRQINKVWSQRELGRRAGIGESIVPRCLEAVRPRLEREDRPKILVGLTDAYQQLYSWAVARNKQQIKKRWNRRVLAEQAGISEASIGNYLGAVQRQLKDENRPKILLGVELSPQEKLYRWVMRRKGKPKQRIAWAVSEIA